ncbi:toxic anion resistance protein [Luteimonas sp. RIT-PG2_3]
MSTDRPDTQLIPAGQELDEASLKALGLTVADAGAIADAAKALEDISPGSLHTYGRDASSKTSRFSTQLLEQVRNRDLDASGDKLGEVVRIARGLNLDAFHGRSKVPVIGALIDKFKAGKGELVQKYSTTNQQIEHLMRDVGQTQVALGQRVKDFDRMHAMVLEERRDLGVHVAAGKMRLSQLQGQLQALVGQEDPQSRNQRAETDTAIRILEKRVSDLGVMQHVADQTLPMIRMIQANAIQLIEKFSAVRDVTIPMWRNHFAIQLSLGEQKNAVELANAIDDASNELMRRNADLMHQTSVDTAKANQRSVVDIDTLRHVHDKLIQTVEEVRSIHREGIEQRQQIEIDLAQLRDSLQQNLATPTTAQQ